MSFQYGLEVLLKDKKLLNELKKKRVSLVGHPASVDQNLNHSIDLLFKKVNLVSAFGPQHGIKGEKQDNMVESPDEIHPVYKIPIFSLYGAYRRPTKEMMDSFDVVLFDLQDLGCRIYTFVTTLLYVMEECARYGKKIIVLDRPNPIGRGIEGFSLIKGQESFVGAGPFPMRHGLTVGELALYYKAHYGLNVDLQIVKMKAYAPSKGPHFGWPDKVTWINPSPNAPNLNMARVYPGSVILEGTTLSEGRGTTRSLEVVGASDIDFSRVHARMKKLAPQWMKGCVIRECFFEPTFHKHQGKTCSGLHIHADHKSYDVKKFKPFRLFALIFKAIRLEYPTYNLYRDFAYEYVMDRLAFDVINGGPELKNWIENTKATAKDLEKQLSVDEKAWAKEAKKHYLYK
jgi:uncharacterized protein YbbC (DUF1343 family)